MITLSKKGITINKTMHVRFMMRFAAKKLEKPVRKLADHLFEKSMEPARPQYYQLPKGGFSIDPNDIKTIEGTREKFISSDVIRQYCQPAPNFQTQLNPKPEIPHLVKLVVAGSTILGGGKIIHEIHSSYSSENGVKNSI